VLSSRRLLRGLLPVAHAVGLASAVELWDRLEATGERAAVPCSEWDREPHRELSVLVIVMLLPNMNRRRRVDEPSIDWYNQYPPPVPRGASSPI